MKKEAKEKEEAGKAPDVPLKTQNSKLNQNSKLRTRNVS
jgi:hypothetical protein